MRYDLYRNRANANLFLARFESALSDAEAAVIPSAETESLDDATLKLNAKAYYRAGRAAYSLRMLSRADAHFQQVESCTPDDVDAKRERKRTASSMEEEKAGCYDFIAMSDAASPTRNRLDHADYIVKVAVRSAGKRGRGLFATQDIPMGDLVLCEKGFGVVFGSESQTETYTMINLNTDRGSMGSHATLLYDLVHKLSYNPEQAKLYFDLYDGGYTPKIPPQVVDGVTVIDTFRTAAISEYNRFGCPNVRSSDTAGQRSDANAENDQEHSVGVWLVASHINHACDENASRAFIGDMMIIRAARDIKAGDEILMRYSNAEKDGTATRAHTMKTWGFECDCPVCEADAPTPKAQLERRKVLGSEAVSFLNNNRLSIQRPANAATIRKVEKLREVGPWCRKTDLLRAFCVTVPPQSVRAPEAMVRVSGRPSRQANITCLTGSRSDLRQSCVQVQAPASSDQPWAVVVPGVQLRLFIFATQSHRLRKNPSRRSRIWSQGCAKKAGHRSHPLLRGSNSHRCSDVHSTRSPLPR